MPRQWLSAWCLHSGLYCSCRCIVCGFLATSSLLYWYMVTVDTDGSNCGLQCYSHLSSRWSSIFSLLVSGWKERKMAFCCAVIGKHNYSSTLMCPWTSNIWSETIKVEQWSLQWMRHLGHSKIYWLIEDYTEICWSSLANGIWAGGECPLYHNINTHIFNDGPD